MSEKSKKTGRPERYPNEESQRISFRSRPRYKKILELLATQRGTTLSEAAELAIAKFASDYQVDGKPLIDYVRPENESFMRYYQAITKTHHSHDGNWGEVKQQIIQLHDELKSTPLSIQSPKDRYQFDFIQLSIMWGSEYLSYFDLAKVLQAMGEDFKEGRTPKEAVSMLFLAAKGHIANHMILFKRGLTDFDPERSEIKITKNDFELLNRYLKSKSTGFEDCFEIIED